MVFYLSKRNEKSTLLILDELALKLKTGLENINVDLEPVINASSRAMGAVSALSDDTKMEQALERRIGQDLMGQNEDIIEVLKIAFPRVAEYIEERPEAISKLMPRLNTLLNDPEARKRLNLESFSSDISRIHREDR